MDKAIITPTDEQLDIIDFVRKGLGNLVVNALAGTGKTSTGLMVQDASPKQPILYLAFNKRIVEEAEGKFSDTTTVRTINSQGHRAWQQTVPKKLVLNKKKTSDLTAALIKDFPRNLQADLWECFWEIVEGVNAARDLGYIPNGKFPQAKRLTSREAFHAYLDTAPSELVADLIDAVLVLSIRTAYEGNIDYSDQLYMPTLFGGTFPRFPLVIADEVQDFSPINHEMLHRLARERLTAFGDPWQSIYAFRGAVQGGMAKLTEKFKAETKTLSVSFRCPQAIVEAARFRTPHLQWRKLGGHVEVLQNLPQGNIADGSAIICRNNAPLFRIAMHLLSAKRSVSVAGSDIGPKIVGIMRKLTDDSAQRGSVLSAIEDWRAEKVAKGSKTADDIADCMKVFAGFGETLSQAVSYAEHLFQQKGSIKLTTGHKAKGLEWDTVYHLDPFLIGTDDQEQNLRYVITTRSKNRLYEIDSRGIQW